MGRRRMEGMLCRRKKLPHSDRPSNGICNPRFVLTNSAYITLFVYTFTAVSL